MGLLTNLLLSVAHLLLVAIDILFFMLLVRVLWRRWRPRWLTAFNSAGQPVVDWFTGWVRKGLGQFSNRNLSDSTVLLIAMLTLALARVLLVALFTK